MEYIIDNKEWIFSGIGVLVLTIILGGLKYFLSKKKGKADRSINMEGNNSVYIENNNGKIKIK